MSPSPLPDHDTGRHSGDLIVEGARQHNLKNISLRIPHNAVTAITGVSGSGKSSLAFDTLYAEGQWRYVESLSTYARMFVERLDRPDVDRLVNIRPAIAIEQNNPVRTARSTVGTTTEIADLLRLLFATIGRPVCPDCREEARGYEPAAVADDLLTRRPQGRAMILFPVARLEGQAGQAQLASLLARGFVRLKRGEEIVDIQDLVRTAPRPSDGPSHVLLDRLILRTEDRPRLIEAVETAYREGQGTCRVEVIGHEPVSYSRRLQCQRCGRLFPPLRPILFSFNHPLGACPACKGFGNTLEYDEDLVVPDRTRSLAEGAIDPWNKPGTDWWQKQMLLGLKRRSLSTTTPYGDLPEEVRSLLWAGDAKLHGIREFFEELERKRYKLHVRVFLSRYRSPVRCAACQGSRLTPEALHVKVGGRTIHDVAELTVEEAARWLATLDLPPFDATVGAEIIRRIAAKLGFLLRVGLSYLTLSRQTRTLSGGEAQRIALANQLGAQLVGTLYVLDEPTIGLHPRDTGMLAEILRDLAARGNTVVVVEHDRQMIAAADHVVELGPGAGEKGGDIVCAAPLRRFLADPRSITAAYLRGEAALPVPAARRRGNGQALVLIGAREHNLQNLTVRIPLQMLVCVTGVSGSGKSTLVEHTLYRAVARAFRSTTLPMGRCSAIKGLHHLRGARLIDQEPIGRTPRSNPITYLKAFDDIRRLFAAQPDARRRDLTAAHFSFNTEDGRCARCQGAGQEKLEMYFFEDLYVTCEDCGGTRFRPEVLSVRYRGRTIHEVLGLTVHEALAFFADAPALAEKLHLLQAIGLGYVRLGQPANTLSGGEAQRLKIAAELQDQSARQMLYVLDEPTTGLHLDDVRKLLLVLGRLVHAGNTVVLVEHHLDVIKAADWVIDLGPEGGAGGGHIVAEGPPERIAQSAASHTGRWLRPFLEQPAGIR